MNKYKNGIIIPMTTKEIEEMKRQQAEFEKWQAMQPPTPEQQIAELQTQVQTLQTENEDLYIAMAEVLGGGV